MITDGQKTTPPRWVPFTRAGCDVGGAGIADVEPENTSTAASGDMTRVFGVGSPEWNEANNPATRAKAQTDLVGIAIHCAAGGEICTGSPGAKPDRLPDEPGGYDGFEALYGARHVSPAIDHGNGCVANTEGRAIGDPAGNCGFPGFDGMLAKNTLGEVAQMQEAGVPVTFGYISDAHDNHRLARVGSRRGRLRRPAQGLRRRARGVLRPAEARRDRPAQHAVRRHHRRGRPLRRRHRHAAARRHARVLPHAVRRPRELPREPGRRGQRQPPEPAHGGRQGRAAVRLPFRRRADLLRQRPAPRTDPKVRRFERDLVSLTAPDPYVDHGAQVPVGELFADTVGEKALHMVNSDPSRTPTFTMFGNRTSSSSPRGSRAARPRCA